MRYLILSNNNLLLRVAADRIAYVASDGSYSVLTLIGGEEHTFSFNLSVFERHIEQQLQSEAQGFMRIGRSLIVNSNYIYMVNLAKQELVLYDSGFKERFVLQVSKEALKALKSALEDSCNNRRSDV